MNRIFLHFHRQSRLKKFQLFLQTLQPAPEMRILNVGAIGHHIGLTEQLEEFYPKQDRIVGGSLVWEDVVDYARSYPEAKALAFDACALPFPDQSFDIVYSNAVIEHLPSWEAQRHFAAEIMRVGRGWFVATPNFWYPLEPHYHLPYVQLLPEAWQKRLARALGQKPYPSLRLLGRRELRRLFPSGTTVSCRVTFWPETLISFRRPIYP